MSGLTKNKINELKAYFQKKDDILLAFIFGSYARGEEFIESDFDVAVYIKQDKHSRQIEDIVWHDLSFIVKKEVDLVCLNNAPDSLVSNVIKTGIPLTIKDKKIFLELYLKVSSEAEDFLRFTEDFMRIKQNARSLAPEEKERLILRFDYLKDELKELDRFKKLTRLEYLQDKDKRKLIERWTENIINASIDAAKITLASEKRIMPKTYE